MTPARARWTSRHWIALAAVAAVGLGIRLWYLPDVGYSDDLGEFARQASFIAQNGLGRAYDQLLSYGPIVAYLWWLFGLIDPAFLHAADSSDLSVRLLLKLPALVGDLGLIALVGYALRARPTWAVVGMAAILLQPAVWFTSAWWGQYESLYVCFVLLAFVLVIEDRPLLAAIALTAALFTKPQTLALVLPFAAWYLARYDRRTVIRAGLTAIVATIVLWLPFLAWGGVARYLHVLDYYQNVRYDLLSLRAWNLWWIVQRDVLHIRYQPDQVAVLGPLTYRTFGFAIAGLLAVVSAYRVYRQRTPEAFALGLAAAALVSFAFLTTMHDRYSYAAIIFLALVPDRRRVLWFSILVGGLVIWNLIASASASTLLNWGWQVDGLPGLVGSLGFCAAALVSVAVQWSDRSTAMSAIDASLRSGLETPAVGAAPAAPVPA